MLTCTCCYRRYLHHDWCWNSTAVRAGRRAAVGPSITRRRKVIAHRANEIMRRSQAGGKFYGHPAAFAVYASARARFRVLGGSR